MKIDWNGMWSERKKLRPILIYSHNILFVLFLSVIALDNKNT